MPGIGSLIRKIHVKITEKWESKTDFRSVKPLPAFKVYRIRISFGQCLDKYIKIFFIGGSSGMGKLTFN